MALTPEMLDAMLETGLNAQQIVDIIKTELRQQEAAKEKKRAAARDRKRKQRAAQAAEKARLAVAADDDDGVPETRVTEGDVTDGHAPSRDVTVTCCDDEVVTVTGCDDADVTVTKESSPQTPLKENNIKKPRAREADLILEVLVAAVGAENAETAEAVAALRADRGKPLVSVGEARALAESWAEHPDGALAAAKFQLRHGYLCFEPGRFKSRNGSGGGGRGDGGGAKPNGVSANGVSGGELIEAPAPEDERMAKLWQAIGAAKYQSWFAALPLIEPGDDGRFVISAPSRFHADEIDNRFGGHLNEIYGRHQWRVAHAPPQ